MQILASMQECPFTPKLGRCPKLPQTFLNKIDIDE